MGSLNKAWNAFVVGYSVLHPVKAAEVIAGGVVGAAGMAALDAKSMERKKLRYQGEIKEWLVKPGDAVTKGQRLCVVRSLKRIRGIPDESEVCADFDGVVVWTHPLGQPFGWTTQIVEIESTSKPVGPRRESVRAPSDTGRMIAAAAARVAKGAAAAASTVARVAEDVAEARATRQADSAEKLESPTPNADSKNSGESAD